MTAPTTALSPVEVTGPIPVNAELGVPYGGAVSPVGLDEAPISELLQSQNDLQGRKGRDLVCLGQPRRGSLSTCGSARHRTAQPRAHISFGYGIHHCLGSRLAELSIVWEEMLQRFPEIIITREPSDPIRSRFAAMKRCWSAFVAAEFKA